jgi:hypothetical protein
MKKPIVLITVLYVKKTFKNVISNNKIIVYKEPINNNTSKFKKLYTTNILNKS